MVNWLKQIVRNPKVIWCFIPSHIFSNCGGIIFLAVIIILIKYQRNQQIFTVRPFYRGLWYTNTIFHHFIWITDILYKHKSLLKHWFDNASYWWIRSLMYVFFLLMVNVWLIIRLKGTTPKFLGLFLLKYMLFKHQTMINIQQWSKLLYR